MSAITALIVPNDMRIILAVIKSHTAVCSLRNSPRCWIPNSILGVLLYQTTANMSCVYAEKYDRKNTMSQERLVHNIRKQVQ